MLKELAETGVSRGVVRTVPAPCLLVPLPPSVVVSRWVGTWRARISSWLHSSLSRRLLRSCHPDKLY